MDQQRFERIARVLASGASRRGVVVGVILAALGRGGGADAQSVYDGTPLGGACASREECVQVTPGVGVSSVVCASNGIDWDGALNCCTYEGGGCWNDAHCCEGLVCGSFGADGSAGRCRYLDRSLYDTPCWSDADCQAYDPNTYCRPGSGQSYCAGLAGARCSRSSQCAGGVSCIDGVCTPLASGYPMLTLAELNMRQSPDWRAALVAVVPAGVRVQVLDSQVTNGYIRVAYGSAEGWVLANLLGSVQG